MRWATRSGAKVDRSACAWLIRRYIDADARFVFVDDPADVPDFATPFEIPGADLAHHDGKCTFEVMVERYELTDPGLQRVGEIVHEADIADERYSAPEARGLDAVARGMAMLGDDQGTIDAMAPVFDALLRFKASSA